VLATFRAKQASHGLRRNLITWEAQMLLAKHETLERLEMYDEKGAVAGSVNRPSDPRLFGANQGTIYLSRPLPVVPKSVRPAHVA
jgi:hypothetical protein